MTITTLTMNTFREVNRAIVENVTGHVYEDELPEITRYTEWMQNSWIDVVRIGPKPDCIAPAEDARDALKLFDYMDEFYIISGTGCLPGKYQCQVRSNGVYAELGSDNFCLALCLTILRTKGIYVELGGELA